MSVKQIMRSNRNIEQTEMQSESEGNSGVKPVTRPKKLKLVLGKNTKSGKWEIHVMYQASWAVIKWGEDSLVTIVTKVMNKNLFSLAKTENLWTAEFNHVPIL